MIIINTITINITITITILLLYFEMIPLVFNILFIKFILNLLEPINQLLDLIVLASMLCFEPIEADSLQIRYTMVLLLLFKVHLL